MEDSIDGVQGLEATWRRGNLQYNLHLCVESVPNNIN